MEEENGSTINPEEIVPDAKKNDEIGIDNNRPGTPLPDEKLWESRSRLKADGQTEEVGIKTPSGEYYEFTRGESFSQRGQSGSRKPFVRMANGQELSFEGWKNLRQTENYELLQSIDADYALAYSGVLGDLPYLAQIKIAKGTKKEHPILAHTGGFWQRPESREQNPAIIISMEHEGEEHYKTIALKREASARLAAERIGIDYEKLLDNPAILKIFIFLHELGHAEDFLFNFQGNKEIDDPITANQRRTKQSLATLPVPTVNPAAVSRMLENGQLESYYDKYKEHYQQRNILSPEDLLKEQEVEYKALPAEVYADNFAANFIRRNNAIRERLGLSEEDFTSQRRSVEDDLDNLELRQHLLSKLDDPGLPADERQKCEMALAATRLVDSMGEGFSDPEVDQYIARREEKQKSRLPAEKGPTVKGKDLKELYDPDRLPSFRFKCFLPKQFFAGLDIRGINLDFSILKEGLFIGSDLSYANLSHADVRGADFRGTDLSYADLSHALIDEATDFHKAVLNETKLPEGMEKKY